MKKLIDFLFMGFWFMAPKPAIYLIAAGTLCAYSERLNGRNVTAELAGDWILVPVWIVFLMGLTSLALNVADAIKQNKAAKERAERDRIA